MTRIEATLTPGIRPGPAVTAADVEAAKFGTTRRGGYDEQTVDQALDHYADALARLAPFPPATAAGGDEFRRWRLAAFSVAAAAATLTAAGALTPALAATGPSMTANHGSVNIAVPGPNHSLRFYWAVNGTSTWHAETVAGGGSTFSAPSMTVNGNTVNIAAEGPNHSLRFYWAINGTSTWHPETVAGPGSVR